MFFFKRLKEMDKRIGELEWTYNSLRKEIYYSMYAPTEEELERDKNLAGTTYCREVPEHELIGIRKAVETILTHLNLVLRRVRPPSTFVDVVLKEGPKK